MTGLSFGLWGAPEWAEARGADVYPDTQTSAPPAEASESKRAKKRHRHKHNLAESALWKPVELTFLDKQDVKASKKSKKARKEAPRPEGAPEQRKPIAAAAPVEDDVVALLSKSQPKRRTVRFASDEADVDAAASTPLGGGIRTASQQRPAAEAAAGKVSAVGEAPPRAPGKEKKGKKAKAKAVETAGEGRAGVGGDMKTSKKAAKQRQREEATKKLPKGAAVDEASIGGDKAVADVPDRDRAIRNEAQPDEETDDIAEEAPRESSLFGAMKKKLLGSRFRMLNEMLYTQPGDASFQEMQASTDLFDAYHEGFRSQTEGWNQNPVDLAVAWLNAKPSSMVVADFGCGDAALADAVPNEVFSIDLVAAKPGVIACNMAHTPLETASVDVAVFSLALMGTDYGAFLKEATRVLKPNGWLWIAEVRSRFVKEGVAVAGSTQRTNMQDFNPFINALAKLGFKKRSGDVSNKMFVVFVFKKTSEPDAATVKRIKWPPLKACIYKRR